jgi:hypothetical protein
LEGTQVTDAGLGHFQDCSNLSQLLLADTQIGDAGLARFKDCKSLSLIHLQNTKVTQAKIDEFHQALPKCKIVCDGRTIEPK